MGGSKRFMNRVLLIVSIFTLFICLSFALYFAYFEYRNLHDSLIKKGNLLSAIFVSVIENSIPEKREKELREIILKLKSLPDISYIGVFNQSGIVIPPLSQVFDKKKSRIVRGHRLVEEKISKVKKSGRRLIMEEREFILFLSPVYPNKNDASQIDITLNPAEKNTEYNQYENVGYFSIIVKKRSWEDAITASLKKSGFIWFIFWGIGTGITWIVTQRIIHPLKKLTESARALALDGSVITVPANTPDEIGKLAETFNIMAKTLKARENAFRESEKRYREIFENSTEGIFQTNFEGKAIIINQALAKMLGYNSVQEILQTDLRTRDFYVDNSERKKLINTLWKKGRVKDYELEFYRKDQTVIPVSLSMHLVKNELGTPIYYEGIVTDISIRKRAEEYRIAKETAESLALSRSRFLANMSHEIRTPLNAIIGLSNLVMKTEMTEKQIDYTAKIRSSAKTLQGIINDILDLSKIESGKMELEKSPFSPEDLFDKIHAMFDHFAQERGLEFHAEIDQRIPPIVVGDALRIQQILVNLVGNAFRFTKNGRVDVRMDLVDIYAGGFYVRICVKDTGIGIHPKRFDRIFDVFAQADSSTTRKFGGTGLGLPICKKLVEKMNGEIRVESEPGKGSLFQVFIPLEKEMHMKPVSNSVDSQSNSALGENRIPDTKVLIVEDNELNRQVASEIIEYAGADVITAVSGQNAIDILKKESVDVILMDIEMPEMDGYETTINIRNHNGLKDIPIIAVTAHAMPEIKKKCIDTGMVGYITKPLHPDKMVSQIADIVKKNDRNVRILPGKTKDPVENMPLNPMLPEHMPGIDIRLFAKRIRNNYPLLMSLLNKFSTDHGGDSDKIRSFLQSGNKKAACEITHGIKGISGNFAANDLFNAAENLEKSVKEKTMEDAMEKLVLFENEMNKLVGSIARLQEMMEQRGESTHNKVSPVENRHDSIPADLPTKELIELNKLLFTNNIRAESLIPEIRKKIHQSYVQAELDIMEESVQSLDFARARQNLSILSIKLGISLSEEKNNRYNS